MDKNWLTVEDTEYGKVLTECSSDAEGKIIIPDGVTKIGDLAFVGCANVKSIQIPDSVTEIGYSEIGRASCRERV